MIRPDAVHATLARHQLTDGYPMVLDLEGSHGIWMRDAVTGKDYLDTFTCFASWPVGYGHPMMADAEFQATLLRAASVNVANSDLYTTEMAEFVEAFSTRATPEGYPYNFWVAGGSLAVENAMKTAFDWKARKLGRTSFSDPVEDLVILHFEGAFHGRSGYTMSVTNTVPDKIGLFPKFPWPRVHTPGIVYDLDGGIANDIEAEERLSCEQIEAAFAKHGDKIAAILIEPMQGEGGDRHFRTEFLAKLRQYADEHEALLVFDEVQTGFFGSGRPWLWQHHGASVAPDVVAFGKKTQVCGIYSNRRVEEVKDHVFVKSSRINSTWGGNLVDMVRCKRFLEIIETEGLADRILVSGQRLVDGLRSLAKASGGVGFDNVRGIGSLVAFDLVDTAARDALLVGLFDQQVLALKSGKRSIRFRLPMILTEAEVDLLLERVGAAVSVAAAG